MSKMEIEKTFSSQNFMLIETFFFSSRNERQIRDIKLTRRFHFWGHIHGDVCILHIC